MYDNKILYRGTRHTLFFILTVTLFSVILYAQNGTNSFIHTFRITFLNALFFFSYAYITIFLLIPEFIIKQKIVWFILMFTLVGVGLSALKLVVSDYIFYASISPENISKSGIMNLRFIVVNTKDMSFIVALLCLAKYVKDYLYAERIRSKLEVQNKEAQGKLLQSQFDPHFMFNTINNLYALSLLNPLKTKEVISRIKIVLHYIIEESQKELVNLNDEVLLVENYIQLEKLRYGKRLKVDYRTDGDIKDFRIPPMILFFLVENCFKHGSSLDAGNPWINILVKSEPGKIVLSTVNSKPVSALNQDSDKTEGQGFKNLRKRLNIIYKKDGYNLIINDEKEIFSATLSLKEQIETGQKKYR